MNHLTLFAWFSGLQIFVIIFLNTLLIFKFRRYYLSSGFGIVTLTLISKIAAHSTVGILYAVGCVTLMVNGGKVNHTFLKMNHLGTIWLTCSMLLHAMGVTFQRTVCIISVKRFLSLSQSKTYIGIMILIKWVVALLITGVTYKSRSAQTRAVFHTGLLVSGVLTIANFICTRDTQTFRDDISLAASSSPSFQSDNLHIVSSPRKAFTMFSGLLFSFSFFCLPISIPNLVVALKGQNISQSASVIMSTWLLLGVVFDCMWVLIRLRSTVGDVSGFYSRWTFNKEQTQKNFPLILLDEASDWMKGCKDYTNRK